MNELCGMSMEFFTAGHWTVFFGILTIFFGATIATVIGLSIKFNIEGLEKLVLVFTMAFGLSFLAFYGNNQEDQIKGETEYAKFLTYALIFEDTEKMYISDFTFEDKSIKTSVSIDRLGHIVTNKSVFTENNLVKGKAVLYGSTNFTIEGTFLINPVYGASGPAYLEYVDLKAGNEYGLPSGMYNKVLHVPVGR